MEIMLVVVVVKSWVCYGRKRGNRRGETFRHSPPVTKNLPSFPQLFVRNCDCADMNGHNISAFG